jgi:DNA-binding phage protein
VKEGSVSDYHNKRLAKRLEDPEFREEYERAQKEIAQVDAIIRGLEERRVELGVSKAQIARQIGKEASSVRRLLTSSSNAELKTVAAVAEALDAEIQLVPKKPVRRRRAAA